MLLPTRLSWWSTCKVVSRSFPRLSCRTLAPAAPTSGALSSYPALVFSDDIKYRSFSTKPAKSDDRTSGIVVTKRKGKGTGYCYGCGADLVKAAEDGTTSSGRMQTVPKKKGYWAAKKDELKKSQIKNWALCPRCKKLQQMEKSGVVDVTDLSPDSQMTEVFRQEVSKIRTKEKAVVVLCVDSINISGSLIKTIRNYVGGNPILLAVTRCDLLPPYVWERHLDTESLKDVFRHRAASIAPAEIYLCSEDPDFRRKTGGIQALTQDLWKHLNGRDPYIIGAANIGKSTLTDILIAKLASKGEKAGHFGDRLSKKRLEALRRSRITKSSLPGTTLQNVRVPCFEDHTQALWDTPGLLLDESLKHFPIRNLRAIRAQRPSQIRPQVWVTTKNAFCLLVCEKVDDVPILRIEVRLKKNAKGDGPIRVVWNSTLNLETKVVDIAEALDDEKRRREQVEEETRREREENLKREQERAHLSKDEKQRRKEQRRREIQEKIEKEKAELGEREWRKRQERRNAEEESQRRFRALSQLVEVHQVVLERNIGTDIAIANLGWVGVLAPRTTLIKSYAPNSGVRITHHPTLALPTEWGEYTQEAITSDIKNKRGEESSGEVPDIDSDSDIDSDYESDEDFDLYDDWGNLEMWDGDLDSDYHDPLEQPDRFGFTNQSGKQDDPQDVWATFSGKYVGWQFDADGRFLKGDLEEGWNPVRKSDDSTNT